MVITCMVFNRVDAERGETTIWQTISFQMIDIDGSQADRRRLMGKAERQQDKAHRMRKTLPLIVRLLSIASQSSRTIFCIFDAGNKSKTEAAAL